VSEYVQSKVKVGSLDSSKPEARGFDSDGNLISPGGTTNLGPDPDELLKSMEQGQGGEDGEFEAISRPTAAGKVETEFPVSRSREDLTESKKGTPGLRAAGNHPADAAAGSVQPEPGTVQEENLKWQIQV
jgi:hypothetical protein